MENNSKKDEIIRSLTSVEFHQVMKEDCPEVSNYMKVPLGEIASLGAGLSALPVPFRTVTQTVTTGGDNLWRMFTLPGATGELQIKNGVTLGTMTGTDGAFSARARFERVPQTSSKTNMVMPIDPTTLFIAAALVSVQKRLNEIQEGQKDIIEFLEIDKRSKLKGNLEYLNDAMNNYKHNWDNETYKSNMHLKVQDIKQESEQNILFYRQRIRNVIDKQSLINAEQATKNQLNKVKHDMEDYQLAVYLYGYSSFLEVLLLGNFDQDYLDSITKKVKFYALNYRELYTESYEVLESKMKTTIESEILNGVAVTSGVIGKAVAQIPFVNKSQLDETLIAGEQGIKDFGEKRSKNKVHELSDKRSSKVEPFVSCIDFINTLYNQPSDILVDEENIYIGIAQPESLHENQ